MILQPKNWSTFQHYKDRNPPWIKLHKDQLNKPDFMSLSLASVGLANMLWLLASETKDGCFDGTMEHLTFRLRKTEREIKTNLKCLIDKGFFIIACGALADDTKSPSEGEAYEPEGEGEAKGDKKKIPPQMEDVKQYCQERSKGVDAEKWFDHYTSNGWKVGKNKMVDWKAAVRTWERNQIKGDEKVKRPVKQLMD